MNFAQNAAQAIPQQIIDLHLTEWKRVKGDITIYGTWLLTNQRPCMVLLPTALRPNGNVVPCIVPLDTAFMWDEHTGDPAHCAQMSYQFANALGLNAFNPRDLVLLTSAIREHLGDLLAMRPMPASESEIVADAIMTDTNTGKTKEAEIKDYV